MRISDGIRFRIIPDWVIESVSPSAVVAYAVLQRFARDTAAQVSQERLARELRCSIRSVRNWLQELETAGAVRISRSRGDQGSFRINEILVLDAPAEQAIGFPIPEAEDCPRPEAGDCLQDLREGALSENREGLRPSRVGNEGPLHKEVFEALARATGFTLDSLTRIERGRLNKAAKDLREVGATAEEIQRRAEIHRRVWPTASLTPLSLAANWTLLGQAETGDDRRRRLIQEGIAWMN